VTLSLPPAGSQIHKDMKTVFKFALVWGTSTKHSPQHCGLSHQLHDEDVVQIVTKTATEQKQVRSVDG
jgi:ribosome-interacting GTPase 1